MQMASVPQPTFYIFKCEQSAPAGVPKPSCVTPNSEELYGYLASTLMQKGIMGPVLPIKTSCIGRCGLGPVMLVEPGHYMYVQLTKERIDTIIDEHIIGGNPVQDFLIQDEFWADPIDLKTLQR